MPRMTAIKICRPGGSGNPQVREGEIFHTTDQEARAFVALGIASLLPEEEQEEPSDEGMDAQEPSKAPAKKAAKKAAKKVAAKSTYGTRRMTAKR